MKNLFKKLKILFTSIGIIISRILTSFILPVFNINIDILEKIFTFIELDYKNFNKIIKKINMKKNIQTSLYTYYILLIIIELGLLINIIRGQILYYELWFIVICTITIFLFSFVFVIFLNKNYKSENFNYIIYFQLLFLLPLGITYWVANIEGHNIYLKDLNSDQWISIFNTIIIYFSGSLIGLVTLYKNNNDSSKNK